MMGRQTVDQSQLFYLFNLERRIPGHHLLRRINPTVTRIQADLREKLAAFYSEIGRPSIDPELMIRMLIVGYCYGIRSERRLCEEVELHLAYRWFCRLDLDDKVPDHSTFSVNRHGRFRDSDAFRHVFEAIVRACMDAGLVKGEGFAVDASVMEADASRYHGVTPEEADWSVPERQTRAVAECFPRMPFRKVTRDINEDARDLARALMGTPEFDRSRDERKRVEMRFAHLKTHHRFERMRLRGLSGARDEFHLAAIVQQRRKFDPHGAPSRNLANPPNA
jgi:transposase